MKFRTKRCSKCRRRKPEGDFYIDNSRSDGLSPDCVYCQKQRYHIDNDLAFIRNVKSAIKQGRIVEDVDIQELLQMYHDDPHCQYCGCELTPKQASLDHRVPISRFGAKTADNLIVSCFDCNRLKWTKTEEEFRSFLIKYKDRLNKLYC